MSLPQSTWRSSSREGVEAWGRVNTGTLRRDADAELARRDGVGTPADTQVARIGAAGGTQQGRKLAGRTLLGEAARSVLG